MTYFKYTNINNEIIHITQSSPENIIIDESGTWSRMNEDEYQDFIQKKNEELENSPLQPLPEPESLTPQQKLEAAGLTVEELKELLGL